MTHGETFSACFERAIDAVRLSAARAPLHDIPIDFVARRTIDLAFSPPLRVEFRVTEAAALAWNSDAKAMRRHYGERVSAPGADGRATREVHALMRERGIGEGLWRVTFDRERVDVERVG